VHFGFGLWTSPNHRAFFGVVGHWITAIAEPVRALMGMEHFRGPYTGAIQAEIIWMLLK